MSDLKSKLPDFKEFTSMASKLFTDIKTSISEIIDDYKKNREQEAASAEATEKKENDVKVTDVDGEKNAASSAKADVEGTAMKTKKKEPKKTMASSRTNNEKDKD